MAESSQSASSIVRFGVFELELRSGELTKGGRRQSLPEQPLMPRKRCHNEHSRRSSASASRLSARIGRSTVCRPSGVSRRQRAYRRGRRYFLEEQRHSRSVRPAGVVPGQTAQQLLVLLRPAHTA